MRMMEADIATVATPTAAEAIGNGLGEMTVLARRHYGEHGRQTAIPWLYIVQGEELTGRTATFYQPCCVLVLEGAKETMLGARRYRYGAGQVLVASVDLPVTAQIVAAPYLGVAMRLNTEVLASLLIDAGLDDTPPPAGMAVSDADIDLISALLRLLRLADRPRDIPALAPLIEREILYLLMHGPHRAMLRQIALPDSRMARIRRAIEWIRANYHRALRIDALAGTAAMSPSAFHRHFKAVTNMSPLQFQKHMRLQEARRRLLTDGGEVASIGFAVGYDSPSQFSREYHRLFGAPPGRDAQALRAGGTLDAPLA
jgi:AraC-like DNA-binding protein